ncbi:carboxypeptidase-like regulatory domain-containing protein [bacterium]|nr:carboxypeptidase-like regulatory domain-containing protein [bacterium]
MKRNISIILIFLAWGMCFPAWGLSFEAGITKEQYLTGNRVIDKDSGQPIAGAEVLVPQKNYKVYTDKNGYFSLNAKMDSPTIVSVKKDGYRAFSTTLLPYDTNEAISLSLVKEKLTDITLECELCHLGDNTYSPSSANSSDFKTKAAGPFYSKTFKMAAEASARANYLVIGSIIGIDTLMAKKMGQNQVVSAYASPPEVYFNGRKIAEIHLNGDNQRIKIPSDIIRNNSMNEVTIKTGHNLFQMARLDYDDIEFMNLSIQSE